MDAVARYFKAIAERRDWRQTRHRDYYTNMELLGEESSDSEEFRKVLISSGRTSRKLLQRLHVP